jgi:hypothetical protein
MVDGVVDPLKRVCYAQHDMPEEMDPLDKAAEELMMT